MFTLASDTCPGAMTSTDLNLYTLSATGKTIIMFQKVALLRNAAAEASATSRHSATLMVCITYHITFQRPFKWQQKNILRN